MRIVGVLALLLAAGVIFAFARYLAQRLQREPLVPMQVGATVLSVELADTPLKRASGLSGRHGLTENEGTLFIFEHSDMHRFWMKDMRFPIDIIWIGEGVGETPGNSAVVGIAPNIYPDSFPKRFIPSVPVRYVLEVNAGWAKRHGIQNGTRVTMPKR